MFAFVLSNLAGLARQVLVANAFGTSAEIEAFNAANRVSETLFLLVAGGALASAFIPTFTTLLTHNERANAWRLASAIFNWIALAMGVALALTVWLAPGIVRYVIAVGFANEPAKEALTITLLRLMAPSAVIFGVSGLVMGILNAHQHFLAPALTPAMYQLGLIFGATVLAPRLGIIGLGWGVLIGASLHLVLQLPWLARLKGQYTPSFGWDEPAVREVVRLLGPRLLGVGVVQLNFWINTRLASQMNEGSVTAVVMAFTLMLMPQAAIAQSVAMAAMPTFSAQYARGALDEVRLALSASLRGILILAIPATAGLIMLRTPIIALLYQRGAFDEASTRLVAWALLWYSAGLVGHSLVELLARAFYALHDTRTPVAIGTAAMLLNVGFSYLFVWLFERVGWQPHGGLALANSLATGIEAAGLYVLMRRRLGSLEDRSIWSGAAQSTAGAISMSIVLWIWLAALGKQSFLVSAAGGVVCGAGIYAAVLVALRVREVDSLLRWLVEKARRSGIWKTPQG